MINAINRLSPKALQEARTAAAERFLAIGMRHVPEGWTYKFRQCRGYCWQEQRLIDAPKPVTRRALAIWLHECAHAHLHNSRGRIPRHVEEMQAEQWAYARMREAGVPVPRKTTARGKAYVARKIRQAKAVGAKRIDPKAVAFAKGK
jgi:hypothetical protein